MTQRKISYGLGVVFLLCGAAPLTNGMFHMGVAVLLLAGLFCLALPWGWEKSAGWRQHHPKWMRAGKILCALAGVGFFLVQGYMIKTAYFTPPVQGSTAVVLGCQVRGEEPSLMLRRRLDVALSYLQEHPEVNCIVSGGQGRGEDVPESQVMKEYLVEHGIDPARILEEDQSTNTRENLENSFALIQQQGWEENIVIITDNFHQSRAGILARQINSETVVGHLSSCGPLYLLPSYWMRECGGIVLMKLGILS
jgi:hypothetical protein